MMTAGKLAEIAKKLPKDAPVMAYIDKYTVERCEDCSSKVLGHVEGYYDIKVGTDAMHDGNIGDIPCLIVELVGEPCG